MVGMLNQFVYQHILLLQNKAFLKELHAWAAKLFSTGARALWIASINEVFSQIFS